MIAASLIAAALLGSAAPADGEPAFVLACPEGNDLHRVLAANGARILRCDRAAEAVERAPAGAGVLILAGEYPERPAPIDPALFARAAAKRLRLYVEYPASLPDLEVGAPREIRWERGVIASDLFGADLPRLRIVGIHGCRYVPIEAKRPHIVIARVAGFDTAAYGLPASASPILFEHPRGGILVATTGLSQFVTARYGPTESWRVIWRAILGWLRPGERVPALAWTPAVRPSYGRDDALPAGVEREAFRRGIGWLTQSRLIVSRSWLEKAPPVDPNDPLGPLPPADAPPGDGRDGILEGFSSSIDCDGSQPVRYWFRNDCTGECAMALALGGAILRDAGASSIAANLCDFVYTHSPLARGPRADPKSPSYGLVGWAVPGSEGTYYGDDNARSWLGIAAAAAALDSTRWDEPLLRTVLANLRTSGRFGFRGNCLVESQLQARGWRPYFEGFAVNYAPHYESYLWACYLWAYRHTGYPLFLERAKKAIAMTLAAYPDRWYWTNGIEQERGRMLLPLAWLVRIEDTAEHRRWLRRMGEDLIALQDSCGALREEIGPGMGSLPPPSSNEAYGTAETSILQANGDPVCDMLYTSNFAFLGLHEAAAATGERLFIEAEEKLAKFLCRIQIRSEAHPELDGAWFRAFDFGRWDYWASNGDLGWGAWSIETGWTHGWIVSVLGMRSMGTSLWELTSSSRIRAAFARLHPVFFPDGDAIGAGDRIEHKGVGKALKLAAAPDPRYPGIGEFTLTDGGRGLSEFRDPAWQGFWQVDLDAVIDLGRETAVDAVESGYLQQVSVGIYLPVEVEVAVSSDGRTFRVAAAIPCDVPQDRPGPFTKTFRASIPGTKARYVRVRAKNTGAIPAGPAKGQKAWLFADEIVIE
ncbi:MAG: discoidin domain-containing protein [Planctomycetes bacterium]|nr:discoidin domain-containing protein [Planctomycetota bacterium]